MRDMRLDSEQKKNFLTPERDTPEYPYGLRLSLDKDTLQKLGIGEPMKINEKVMVLAKAEVFSVRKEQEGDENSYCMELQIKEMELKKEDEEKRPASKVIYGN